jgi:GT2 family glycosyltransferase
LAGHAYVGLAPQNPVHRGRLQCLTGWGAVTGACLMVRREVFERLGGFDEAFPVEGNDVEFCLRLDALGYRQVVDPSVCFVHRESQSRKRRNTATQVAAMRLIRARWGERLRSSAPWWPQACSPHHSDGRPLGLEHLL